MSTIYLSSNYTEGRSYLDRGISSLKLMGHQIVLMPSVEPDLSSEITGDPEAIFVGIYGNDYGYVPDGPDNPKRLAAVELEYQKAKTLRLRCLFFMMRADL